MKPARHILRNFEFRLSLCIICISLFPVALQAQLCSNPLDSVYGLTTNGEFHSINVNNGAPSVGILGGVAVTNAVNANGLGFSSLTGKFYFFNHCADGSGGAIEFVSYDPISKTKQILATPPAPMTTGSSDKIRTGAVNNAGTGYYTLLTTSPGTAATFYYYSIPLNTWKVIAQAFKDTATGVSMDSMFHNLNSGDMTFDGMGNLWILCSKSPKYALYKVAAPVTTNTVPKLAVTIMIRTRNMPLSASVASITGVAFNSAGKLYLSTGSNSALAAGVSTVGTNYNILYRMTSVSPLVIDSITNMPNSYGDDLTSCTYPMGVLPVVWVNFTATFQTKAVQLTWTANEKENVSEYAIEFSTDGEHWQKAGHVAKDNANGGSLKTYRYDHHEYNPGNNYYRIVQVSATGEQNNSAIKYVNTKEERGIYIGPNPTKDVIYVFNRGYNYKYVVRVCDKDGRIVYSTVLPPDQPSINIGHLPKGVYVLNLLSSAVDETPVSYRFIKW
ncbi:MAG: T9SS type A sorting domain-containing protein [Chitinophagales bacterium]